MGCTSIQIYIAWYILCSDIWYIILCSIFDIYSYVLSEAAYWGTSWYLYPNPTPAASLLNDEIIPAISPLSAHAHNPPGPAQRCLIMRRQEIVRTPSHQLSGFSKPWQKSSQETMVRSALVVANIHHIFSSLLAWQFLTSARLISRRLRKLRSTGSCRTYRTITWG